MNLVKVVEVKRSILADNDLDADLLRHELNKEGIYYINLMSSPGSGKTSLLKGLITKMPSSIQLGVMEADIDSDVDAQAIRDLGIDAIQLHTGGMCHLDADMSRQGFKAFKSKAQMVILENVGNLVCPAEYDTGAHLKIMILSVTEGDDKPLKYPLMFSCVDAVIINKIDTLSYFDFNIVSCKENIHKINQKAAIFEVSCKTGEGIDALANWLNEQYEKWQVSRCE